MRIKKLPTQPPARLKKSIANLIQWERIGRVATAGPTGMPHVVPVCHVLLDDKIYFASAIEGRKMENLAANPRLSIVFDLYTDVWPNKGVLVQGRASLIRRGPRFRKIRSLLYAKFPQYPGRAPLDESDSVMIELTPTRVFSWGIE
jgi:nitroimidazol reductase NimA-like FMN-containing flavoprotein (pyridoxamine 5'-phosphate oxidase superfamily)